MSEVDFYNYLGKQIEIIDINGKKLRGFVDDVSNPSDEEDGLERVTLDARTKYCRYIELLADEISSIKEIN